LLPFAAKSLTHATTLFLAASPNYILDGISVLSTRVSVLTTILVLPELKMSKSSEINLLFPNIL